ncbi:MAG: hypothetical protein ACYDAJ_02645 [Nitrosotalea sp.]
MTRLIIINSEKFGLSPAEKQFAIHWVGNISQATLTVDMQTSFGYGLTSIIINGTTFKPDSDSHFSKDVKDLLLQGNNKVTVIFNALQIFGQPLGSAQITATLDYFGGTVIGTPSVQQAITDIENTLTKNFTKVLIGIIGVAVVVSSLAYVSSRLPNAGKVNVADVGHSAKNTFEKSTSHVKHAIMTIKEKV